MRVAGNDAVISAFGMCSALLRRCSQATRPNFTTTSSTPVLIKGGQTGNYSAAQMATTGNDSWLIVVNDAGNAPLRFNGTV